MTASPALAVPVTPNSTEIARRIEEIAIYISSTNFADIYPDGTRDSTAGLTAAIATVPENGVAIIAPGTYNLTGSLNAARANITIVGYGATLVQKSRVPIISVGPGWPGAVGVSKMTLVEEASSDPGAAATSLTHKITTTANSNLRAGDLFKIVSDDVIDDARTAVGETASFIGEYAVVKRINGTTLYTVGRLRESYATNIRLVPVPKNTLEIRGFTVKTDDVGLSTVGGYGALINIRGLYRPKVIDISCPQAAGPVIAFQGCFEYLVDNADIGYAINDTGSAQNTLGYAVFAQSCTGGVVQNSSMRFVRHAYTDDTPRIGRNTTEWWNYGRTFGTKVTNCTSLSSSSTAFDTHHASENVQFISCSATSGGAGAAGFQLRGKSHTVNDCRVDWMDFGVLVFTEGERGGRSWGHVLNNLTLTNIAKTAIVATINPTGHDDAGVRDTKLNARVNGVVITNARWGIDCVNATVDVRNCRFVAGPGVTGETYAVVRNRNSNITLSSSIIDFTANTAGTIQYCYSSQNSGQESLNSLDLRNILLLQSPSAATRADRFLVGTGQQVNLYEVEFDYPLRIMPGSYSGNSSLKWRCTYDPTVARSDLSSAFHYFEGTVTADLGAVWNSDDQEITVQLKPTTAGQVLAPFSTGRRRAQRLTFLSTGAGTAVINNGATYKTKNIGGAAVTLKQDSVVSYMWDGSVWRQLP